MTDSSLPSKRPISEFEHNDKKKMKLNNEFCAFWIEKKKRNCLTKHVDGYIYCQMHLDKTPSLEKAKTTEIRSTQPDLNNQDKIRCGFWVARKRRFCKCIPPKGATFCIEHAAQNNEDTAKKRIPCPYDSKHSCYESQLQSHLNKCNSRPSLNPVFYEQDINSGDREDYNEKTSIHDFSLCELERVIEKVESLYEEHKGLLEVSEQSHSVFDDEMKNPTNGQQAIKHLKQLSSLIGNMQHMSLLEPSTTYVEFGAGRGGLSHWIQKANPSEKCAFVLIDRSSVRYKKDNYHKGEDQGPSFQRIKIDIQHLALDKVQSLNEGDNDVTCVGKHLCGAATDLMLRCLAKSVPRIRVKGVMLALCCHHRCTWKSYVGCDWLESQRITSEEFMMIVRMSAWATCGTKHFEGDNESTEMAEKEETAEESSYFHPRYGSLLPERREEIGVKCKRLIDVGRIKYLQEKNFDCNLIQYVPLKTTLENYALTAIFKNKINTK